MIIYALREGAFFLQAEALWLEDANMLALLAALGLPEEAPLPYLPWPEARRAAIRAKNRDLRPFTRDSRCQLSADGRSLEHVVVGLAESTLRMYVHKFESLIYTATRTGALGLQW